MLELVVAAIVASAAYWFGGRNRDKQRDKDQRDADAKTMDTIRGAVRPDLSDSDVADSLRKHSK